MDASRTHSIPRNVHITAIVRQKEKPRFRWDAALLMCAKT